MRKAAVKYKTEPLPDFYRYNCWSSVIILSLLIGPVGESRDVLGNHFHTYNTTLSLLLSHRNLLTYKNFLTLLTLVTVPIALSDVMLDMHLLSHSCPHWSSMLTLDF